MARFDDYELLDEDPECIECVESLQEAVADTKIGKFRAIVASKACALVEGYPVDLFSAHVIVTVHDNLSPHNQARFMAEPNILRIAQIAYRLV